MKDGTKPPFFIKLNMGKLIFSIPDDESLLYTEYNLKFILDDGYSRPNERYIKLTIKYPDSFSGLNNGIIASLKIVSITKDQKLRLKIVGPKGSERLLQKFNEESLKIRVKDKSGQVDYNITSRIQSQATLVLTLKFSDIKEISKTTVRR
jgi:hypothetical protein